MVRQLFYIVLVLSAFGVKAQERIIEISRTFAGDMGSSFITIDEKKTVFTSISYMRAGEDNYKERCTKGWDEFVKGIDLEAFKQIKGEVIYDASVTITIKTDKGTYSKDNGNGTQWEWIEKYVDACRKRL